MELFQDILLESAQDNDIPTASTLGYSGNETFVDALAAMRGEYAPLEKTASTKLKRRKNSVPLTGDNPEAIV